ncbi:hypothetical protein JI750_09295 [Flavobacterium sp. GN10]|uniref:Lipoprotein n=1 Tax=Flavobacterium tagetis TaxID=2801336 RepID=A0ABS1KEH9_9FLAO|nr:hypothetical protein [Flavobacterium tagetis]MBL0737077.1 hypothetical protein [Flavobacterium tagetis]
MKEIITNILFFLLFKNKNKYKIILFCFVLSFFGCNNATEKDRTDEVIEKLTERYPQLNKGDSDYYRLIRSVSYDNNSFEIQLRTEPDSISDRQSILVFINSKKEQYAIPFFSNSYVDYWQFPNDQSSKSKKKSNATFNNELRGALLFLKRDNKIDLFDVAEEMRHSLLLCTDLTLKDSLLIKTNMINLGKHTVDDTESEAQERVKTNYKSIMKNNYSYALYHKTGILAYLDQNRFRIYQFIYHHDGTFSVKCYRQDRRINITNI